jgi:hypothetical protein
MPDLADEAAIGDGGPDHIGLAMMIEDCARRAPIVGRRRQLGMPPISSGS